MKANTKCCFCCGRNWLELPLITLWCTIVTIIYAMMHDQILTRICLEYFTRGFHKRNMESWKHEPFFAPFREILIQNEDNPTIVALVWGFVASWFVGAIVGCILSVCYLIFPKDINLKKLIRNTLWMYLIAFICSVIGGFIAWYVCPQSWNNYRTWWYTLGLADVPRDKWGLMFICNGINSGLYLSAAISVGIWLFYVIFINLYRSCCRKRETLDTADESITSVTNSNNV